jgi:tyrosine-protein kinase Etk/Wzc
MAHDDKQEARSEARVSGVPAESLGGWGIVEVLVRNRRPIIWYPLAVAVIVVIFSLLVPSSYMGEVTILPPDRDFQSISLMSLSMADLGAAGGMSLPFMATPSDILSHVLQSRRVLRAVVDSLDLDSVWQVPSADQAVSILRAASSVEVDLTGLVRVRVVDEVPQRAADIANVLVSCADGINRSIANAKARHTREFIGERLIETRAALVEAAGELEAFQREHKTVSLDDELRALIQNVATLNAQVMADDIELSILKKNMSSQNPRVVALEDRVAEMRRRLAAMESGDDTAASFLSTGLVNAPQLILDLAEKMRRVKIEETLLELLTSQYESAKIQEAKDTPTISVLDQAAPNLRRFSPRRARLVIASYGASLAMMIAMAFIGEYFMVMRRREPEKYDRLREVIAVVRRDGLGLKRRGPKSKKG